MKLSGPLLALASCMLLALPVQTSLAACSDGSDGNKAYVGKATLNEYYHNNQSPINAKNYFIEAKLLYTNLNKNDYGDWSILICSQIAADNLSSECITGYQPMTNPADPAYLADTAYDPALQLSNASGNQSWLVLDQSTGYPAGYIDNNGGAGHGMEVFLLDANGEIIDYTSVGGYTKHAATLGAASCNYLFDNTIPGSNTFTTQRLEDGTGCWPQSPTSDTDVTANGTTIPCLGLTPPSGSSGDPTDEAPNLDTSSTGNYLYISLSPELATAPVGGTVSYTVSINGALVVTNKTTYTDTTITTSDIDLTFQVWTMDGTTTAPAPSVSTITIPAGSSQASFTVDTSTLTPDPAIGSDFITLISIDPTQTFPANKNTRGAFFSPGISLVTFVGSGPDHYEISFVGDGVTCEAQLITVTAHDASHTATNLGIDATISVTTSPAVDAITTSPFTIPAGSSSASFYLTETTATSGININVIDGSGVSETSGSAIAADDPALNFVNTAFRFVDTATSNAIIIGNQIGGKPSSTAPGAQALGLQPIRTDDDTGSCVPAFVNQTTSVNLGYECNNPATCSASNLLNLSPELSYNTGTAVTLARNSNGSVASYTPVSLSFDANGIAPLSFIYNDVGQITLHATKTLVADATTTPPVTAATLTGRSNPFVVSPFGFYVDFSGERAADFADDGILNGSSGTNYAADAAGTSFLPAGSDFTLDFRAVLWEAADDADNDGIPDPAANLANNTVPTNFGNETTPPDITIGYLLNAPAGGTPGTLTQTPGTLTAADFADGSHQVTFNWDEVGILDITVDIASYLGAALTTTLPNLGYFYPDHFTVVAANNGSFANSCTTYTYIGESFNYDATTPDYPQFTISAVNVAGNVTQNYTGGFNKIDLNEITLAYPTKDNITNDTTGNPINVATTTAMTNHTPVDNGNGTTTLTLGAVTNDDFVYDRTNALIAPFSANLDINLTGITETTDGISATGLPVSVTPSGGTHRFGIGFTTDAYGTQAQTGQSLVIPVGTRYFDGSGWQLNADDSCTVYSYLKTDNTVTTIAAPVSPVSLNNGAGDLTLTLTNSTNGGTSVIDTTFPTWLRYDWGSGTFSDNPSATATFGIFRGDDRFLYWNEVR